MEFKEKLKTLRLQNGLSQETLAKEICVSRSAIAKWESGLGIPNDSNVEELCRYFDVDEDWLLDVNDLKKQIRITKRHVFTFITGALGVITPLIYVLLGFTLTFKVHPFISFIPKNLPSLFQFITLYAETKTKTSFYLLWFSIAIWAVTAIFAIVPLAIPNLRQRTRIYCGVNLGLIALSLLIFLILFYITVNVNGTIYYFYPSQLYN